MEEATDSEQISDNFTCAVCLDVLYKPIILVCGHVSCFWCCQHSMHSSSESHCPLCRHPYHHFPAICHTLHFLLKKLYPISYYRKNMQMLEDEKNSTLGFSPDLDSLVTNDELRNSVGQSSVPSLEDEFSVDLSTEANKLSQNSARTYKQISVSDVLCSACKRLLFRPAVLNCGHVYCEGCITIPSEGKLKCQVCACRHPSGHPKVCRQFDQFIEEQFSTEYASRRSIIQQNQEQIQNTSSSNEASTQFSKLSVPPEGISLGWWNVHRARFHVGAGCDMCGMFPIIGDRYHCKDCTEISGYDLCVDCYKTGSNVPGRFNQKHKPTHRLELARPTVNHNVMPRALGRRQAFSFASRNQISPNNSRPSLPSFLDEDDISSATREDQSDYQPPI